MFTDKIHLIYNVLCIAVFLYHLYIQLTSQETKSENFVKKKKKIRELIKRAYIYNPTNPIHLHHMHASLNWPKPVDVIRQISLLSNQTIN